MSSNHFEQEEWQMPFDLEYSMGLSHLGGWIELIGRWLCRKNDGASASDATQSTKGP
ncbi:MAG TPA: hypothetical protein VGP93_08995 [Polyangiaceae bacterium]|nr:hypothetical protein [Polyangiaceae bacterium]